VIINTLKLIIVFISKTLKPVLTPIKLKVFFMFFIVVRVMEFG